MTISMESESNWSGGEPGGVRARSYGPIWLRTLRAVVVSTMLAGLFSGVLAATSMSPASADWQEECVVEGCSSGEAHELWEDFRHECITEGCYSEEVGELAGSSTSRNGAYNDPQLVDDLMRYFDTQNQQVRSVRSIPVKIGRTDDLWATILDFLDGRVFGIKCDLDNPYYLTDCNPNF